jgi:iron complex outermembrane receptor protein
VALAASPAASQSLSNTQVALTDQAQTAGEQTPSEKQSEELPRVAETIVVTASRTDQPLLSAPVSVTVVSAPQIEASGAYDFADLLRGVPGLNVVQFGARDVNFNSRSATSSLSNSQLVLLDGRSIYLDFFGVVFWDLAQLDLDSVKQIEIVRGPGSAVWGANAVGGVMNIRTKSPAEMQGGLFTLAAGEVGTREASVRWAEKRNTIGYTLSASYFEQDAWPRDNTLPNGAPFPAGYAFKSEGTRQPKFDLRFDWDPKPGTTWSYRAGYGGSEGIINTGLGPFRMERGSYLAYLETDYTRGPWEAKAYWNHLDIHSPSVLFPVDTTTTTDTVVGEFVGHRAFGQQALTFGANLRLNHFDLSIAPSEHSRNDAGAFVEDQWFLNPRLTVNLGIRGDKFDTLATTFSPRVGLWFMPQRRHVVRLSYDRAFRAPSLVENFMDIDLPTAIPIAPGTPPFVLVSKAVGDRSLHPEVAHAIELGYSVTLDRRSTLSLTLYQHSIKDNIRFLPVAFFGPSDPPPGWPLPSEFVPALPKTFTFLNIGTVTEHGAEMALRSQWAPKLSTTLSYTYQSKPDVVNPNTLFPLQLNQPPAHQASLSLAYSAARMHASVSGAYTARAFWSDVLDERFWGWTKDYVLVNGTVGVPLYRNQVELVIKGTNLTDNKIKQHVFGDIIGRRVAAELRVHWKQPAP